MLIFSSFEPKSPEAFIGWCWIGSDLVVGTEGAARFHLEQGQPIKANLDGCYVSARETVDGLLLSTDSRGLARLFVYKDSTCWAVGSSLYGLIQHLRAHGKTLEPQLSALAPYSIRGSFTSQMTSSETIFHGVELVPSYVQVLITHSGRIRFIEEQLPDPTDDYERDLSNYLSLWRSRLATLLLDDRVNLSTDLSGGIDSRTVLAFLVSLRNVANLDERFRFASSPSRQHDFEAASRIASYYGFTLNGARPKGPRRNEHARLESWKEHSLGVYLLVYFDGSHLNPCSIQAHGAGGGNFRPVFKGASLEKQILSYKAKMPADLYWNWRKSVLRSINHFTTRDHYTDPLILHYREFRNRFHFGHKPHGRVVFTPLNSGMTDALTDTLSGATAQQFYFDIMESLAPGLKDFPYDDQAKMPRPEHERNITRAPLPAPNPGKVFGDLPPDTVAKAENTQNAYNLWIAEAQEAMSTKGIERFLGPSIYGRAKQALNRGLAGERLASNSRDTMDLSYALSVHFAFGAFNG